MNSNEYEYGTIPVANGKDKKDSPTHLAVRPAVVKAAALGSVLALLVCSFGRVQNPGKEKESKHWPDYLVSQASLSTKRPTNTIEAMELGWQKSEEPCVPSLGEPWLFRGVRSANASVTMYFTPAAGNVAGVLSGIEVDYYGYLETKLIGSYFSEQRTSKDGSYHSLAVAFRNSAQQDLCRPTPATDPSVDYGKYIAIAPDLANKPLPIQDTLSELTSKWQQGSCIPQMGYHWWQDTQGGPSLSYKAENTVPIVPMYDSVDGTLNGLFFLATEKKQIWPDSCGLAPTPECMSNLNFWDPGPGLKQANDGRLYVCSNLCGECNFTGSSDGVYTTMHWFFKDPTEFVCPGSGIYCPSGSYPLDFN